MEFVPSLSRTRLTTLLERRESMIRTTRHDASYWDYSIGFRCCADLK
jgi:hypothetical protein